MTLYLTYFPCKGHSLWGPEGLYNTWSGCVQIHLGSGIFHNSQRNPSCLRTSWRVKDFSFMWNWNRFPWLSVVWVLPLGTRGNKPHPLRKWYTFLDFSLILVKFSYLVPSFLNMLSRSLPIQMSFLSVNILFKVLNLNPLLNTRQQRWCGACRTFLDKVTLLFLHSKPAHFFFCISLFMCFLVRL